MPNQNAELKQAGLKVTLPRVKILQILEQAAETDRQHLSAEDVYKMLLESGDDVGLATVYRVLTQFESAKLVERHHFEGGHSVFELAKGEHHDHMVCVDSGEVMEFYDPIIENRQREIAAEQGYDIVDHSMVLYVKKRH
ncbi:MAG: ferric iron uptake transcriptional regulator [Pseudomonadota bacterium]